MKLTCLNRLPRPGINVSNLFLIYPLLFQVVQNECIYENIYITLETLNFFWTGDNKVIHAVTCGYNFKWH